MLYKVAVTITGIIQVEANTEEEAERIAAMAKPMLQNRPLLSAKTMAKGAGRCDDYVFQPANVKQSVKPH